jgi:hypothetical protein
MLARLSGATISASPAAAGTGDKGYVPVWTASNPCGLFLKACRRCRWALEEAGEELVNNLQRLMPGATAQVQLLTL